MNEQETPFANIVQSDTFARLLACITEGNSSGATTLEMHNALAVYFRKASELMDFLKDAATDPRGRAELEIAQSALILVARETAMYRQGLSIELDDLDRAAVLHGLCETIVASLVVAKVLEMDIHGALQLASRHIYIRGNQDKTWHGSVRKTEVRVPFGKLSMQDFV